MELLPYRERATIDLRKLRDYVLSPDHPLGKHKARVFNSLLGIDQAHAESFAAVIRGTLVRAVAEEGIVDQYGARWTTYHKIAGLDAKVAIVSVAWILRADDPKTPNFLTCYIDVDRQEQLATLIGTLP